jgi:hypothetical protein
MAHIHNTQSFHILQRFCIRKSNLLWSDCIESAKITKLIVNISYCAMVSKLHSKTYSTLKAAMFQQNKVPVFVSYTKHKKFGTTDKLHMWRSATKPVLITKTSKMSWAKNRHCSVKTVEVVAVQSWKFENCYFEKMQFEVSSFSTLQFP